MPTPPPDNESSGDRKCSPDEEDPPCEDECGCEDENESSAPVQYSTGKIRMTETDVTANVPGFAHGRVWRNRISGNANYDGPNGFNWDVQEWPYLIQRTTSGGKVTINCRIGSLQLRFDKVGSDYVARHSKSDRYTLTHDSGTNLFTLTRKTNGGVETIQFQDFTQTTNPVGLMWQRITPQGFVTQVTSYTADDNIAALTTTRGTPGSGGAVFEMVYGYHGSGTHLNKIEHVTLNKLDQYPSPTTTTPIRRCRYEYHDGTNNEGSLNDLKAAIIQKPAPGSAWTDIEVCYYRYYVSTGNDSQGNPIPEANGYIHGLKYVLGPAAYAELKEAGQDALLGPSGYPSGGDLLSGYADNYFEYGESQRVTKEVARGCSACGSSGGTGNSGETFTRAFNPNYPGAGAPSSDYLYNTWKTKTVSQDHPGHETIVYTNRVNRVMLKVKRELDTGGALRQWCTYYEYDDNGRQILMAEPSAVTGFNEALPDLVGKQSATPGSGSYQYLKPSEGLVHVTTHYASTTATSSTPGGVEGYEESTGIREGTQSTLIKTGLTTYLASDNGGSGGEVTYAVAERTTYPDTTNQDATKIVTSYSYQWYAPSGNLPVRMKERVTTLPVIPTAQNGDNVSATRREFFDETGNLTWEMDERGIVNQMVYEPIRDQMTQKIEDVASVPPAVGWSVTPGSHFGYETDYEYDDLGRPTLMLGPSHDADTGGTSQTVRTYQDTLHLESAITDQALGEAPVGNQVRSAPGYTTGSPGSYAYNLVDPVSITFSDKLGRTLDQVQSKRSSSGGGSGRLAESDTFLRTDWSRWSVMHYTKKGQLAYQRDYFDIPAQSPDQGLDGINETPGTATSLTGEDGNYNETFHGYDPETNLRVRTKSPNGTITRTVYDKIDRPVQTYVGTDDIPEPISGLIGHWQLDEGSGTTAHDTSDTDNSGTVNNATWSSDTPPTTPSLQKSLAFNGTNANVTAPDVPAYAVGGRLTVAAWVKSAANDNTCIAAQYDWGNNQRSWQMSSAPASIDASKFRVVLSNNGQYNANRSKNWSSSITAFDNTWHHVAFTFETGQLKLYIDGVEDPAPVKLFDAPITSLHNSTASLTLGSTLQSGNGVSWFNGNIADVRVYDRALSPVEVAELAAIAGQNDLWERWSPPTPGSPATPGNAGTNLVLVSETEYDGGLSGGNSNVTKTTAVVDANTRRETRYAYDFRDRKTIDDGEETLYAVTTYDNLDRVTQIDQHDTTAMGHLIARQLSFYDDRSRVYRTRTPEVDPTTGTVGSGLLEGNRYYDPAGNLIRSIAPGDGIKATYQTFDNLGRVTLNEIGYDDTGATNGRVIAESTEITFDAASNAIASLLLQLNAGTTSTSQTDRASYSFAWFDGIGRQIASVQRGASWVVLPRPANPPTRSDTELVTTMQYNDRGEQFATIDPMDREVRTTFDDLGRTIKVVENYTGTGVPASPGSDDNRTTETAYTPDGQVRTLTAVMSAAGTTNQVTTYVYGTTLAESALVSNDLLVETIYPDGAPGTDSVRLAYNRQGQVTQRVDQAGTTHDYLYDRLGRLRHDCVVAFGPGVHTQVHRLTTEYEVRGMPAVYSSASTATPNPSGSGGSVINQVLLEYNGFGQLVNDYQSHTGAVDTATTPVVTESYSPATNGTNFARHSVTTYPNGNTNEYSYGLSSSINYHLNRVQEFTATNINDVTANYDYLGLSTTARFTSSDLPTDLQLDHWGGAVGPFVTYTGLDRFNRIIDHPWTTTGSGGTTLAHFQYGYDRNSNRLYRADLEAQSQSKDFDELYTYDNLDRLDLMKRGLLNTAKDGIQSGTLGFEQDWDLDPVGNWATFEQDSTGAGSFDLTQERDHNKVNEITEIYEGPGEPQWPTPAYDPAGNTTTFPQGGDPSKAFNATYDAWNRLCKVVDPAVGLPIEGGGHVASYEYDARGFRIRRREYDVTTGSYEKCYDDYFNSRWQLLETRVTTNAAAVATDVLEQYVWHASADAYIDQLLLRRRDTSLAGGGTPGTLNETLIALQDAHYNVAALADTNGVVQERYAYSPYGQREILDASYGPRTSSSFAWEIGHQGLHHDEETGLVYNRTRYMHPQLGRFIQRDPHGTLLDYTSSQSVVSHMSSDRLEDMLRSYDDSQKQYNDGLNLFQYVTSSPLIYVDPQGMTAMLVSGSEDYLRFRLCNKSGCFGRNAPKDLWVCVGYCRCRAIKYLPKGVPKTARGKALFRSIFRVNVTNAVNDCASSTCKCSNAGINHSRSMHNCVISKLSPRYKNLTCFCL